ncbi:flippase-like domain-containing protein [bacterium]|nr:flippase-like domain-containing protein [bacterium]
MNKLHRYWGLFILISLIALGIIIGITITKETWTRLNQFSLNYLLIMVISVILRWFFDGLSLRSLINGNSSLKIGLWKATKMRLQCTFVAVILPVVLGSTAFQVYLLHKEKVSTGESVAITSIRAILPILIFVLLVPLFWTLGFQNGTKPVFVKLIRLASTPLVISLAAFTIAVVFPNWIKKALSGITNLIRKIGWLKFKNLEKVEHWLNNEVDELHTALTAYWRKGKWSLTLATFWCVLFLLMEFSIAILILAGFGIHLQLIKAFGIQFLLKAFLYLAPTPGGSGINEFSYLGFFGMYAPKYLLGVAVLMWRFFAYYISVIAGGITMLKDHRMSQIDSISPI